METRAVSQFRQHLPLKISRIYAYNVGVSVRGGLTGLCGTPILNRGIRCKEKGENKMRKYKSSGTLETVICNGCGKKLVVEKGILREGAFPVNHAWDFFSEKDGEIHHWDLCEECYDALVSQFRIAPDVEESVEFS